MSENSKTSALFGLHSQCLHTAFVTGRLALLTVIKASVNHVKKNDKEKFSQVMGKLSPAKTKDDIEGSRVKTSVEELYALINQFSLLKLKKQQENKNLSAAADDVECIVQIGKALADTDIEVYSPDQLSQSLEGLKNSLTNLKNTFEKRCEEKLETSSHRLWMVHVCNNFPDIKPDLRIHEEKDPSDLLEKIEKEEPDMTKKLRKILDNLPRKKQILYLQELIKSPLQSAYKDSVVQTSGGEKRTLQLHMSLTNLPSHGSNTSESEIGLRVKIDLERTTTGADNVQDTSTDAAFKSLVQEIRTLKQKRKACLDFMIGKDPYEITEVSSGSLVLNIRCKDEEARQRLESKMGSGSLGIILKNLLWTAGVKSPSEDIRQFQITLKLSNQSGIDASKLVQEGSNLQFIVVNENLFMEELCPSAMVDNLAGKGLDMEQVRQALDEHPHDRLYQASCLLATLVKHGEDYCVEFRKALAETGHGYLKMKWDPKEQKEIARGHMKKIGDKSTEGYVGEDEMTSVEGQKGEAPGGMMTSTVGESCKSLDESSKTESEVERRRNEKEEREEEEKEGTGRKEASRGFALGPQEPQQQNVGPFGTSGIPVEESKFQEWKQRVDKPSSTSSVEFTGSREQNENLDDEWTTQEEEKKSHLRKKRLHKPSHIREEERDNISTYMKFRGRYGFYFDAAIVVLIAIVLYFTVYSNDSFPIPRTPDGETDIKSLLKTYQKDLDELKGKISHEMANLPSDLQNAKSSIHRDIEEVYKSVENVGLTVQHVQEDAEKKSSAIQEKLTETEKSLEELKKEQKEKFSNIERSIDADHKEVMTTVNDRTNEFQRNQKKVEKDLDKILREDLPAAKQLLENHLGQVKDELQTLSGWKVEIENWKKSVTGEVKVLNQQGYEMNTMMILVIVIIILVVALVVMIMLRQKNSSTSHSHSSHAGQLAPVNILNKVIPGCAKDRSVCVVSFNKSSEQFHIRLTESVLRGSQQQLSYLMDSHQNILYLPPSKVMIVYVDKNERNIILEDESQELGDLRRTTVEAALVMGASVFVVYVHDDGSRNLGDRLLYNSRLTSITRHRVLSKLERQNAVLSVYDSFTQYQKRHLQEAITNAV